MNEKEVFQVHPIAFVRNQKKEIEDDNWGEVTSEIILAENIPDSTLDGIEDFSHLEIIYLFHKICKTSIDFQSLHPRGNSNFPKTGIFAQRKKRRPNFLGLSMVSLIEKREKSVLVSYLDAIDGTPVLDIKPVYAEFIHSGSFRQPKWSIELMRNYWDI